MKRKAPLHLTSYDPITSMKLFLSGNVLVLKISEKLTVFAGIFTVKIGQTKFSLQIKINLVTLREKWPNTELFLFRIFPHSD